MDMPEYQHGNALDTRRGHKLFPPSVVKLLPTSEENEADFINSPDEVPIKVKFFATGSSWTWYAMDYDPEHRTFFGLVDGLEKELGSFSLDELASLVYEDGFMKGHPRVERDLHWKPRTYGELKTQLGMDS